MGWDKTLPGTSAKLRSISGNITDNWKAIEEADEVSGTPIFQRAILLGDRSVVASAADPTVVGATTYLYSKQDGGGVQELYVKDAAGNAMQFTNGGKIGSTATNYEADTISFDGTNTYNEDNMFTAWALAPGAGGAFTLNKGVQGGFPGSVTRTGTGNYTIDITGLGPAGANFTGANDYTVLASVNYDSANYVAGVRNKTATSFKITIDNLDKSPQDKDFTIALLS